MEVSTGAGLDPAFVTDWAGRYLEAWNTGDAQAIASMCSEDVSWFDPGLPETVHGRDAVRRFVEDTHRAFAGFRVEELAPPLASEHEPLVFAPYRMMGTFSGRWEPLRTAPTGARFSVDGIDTWLFRGGLMCRYVTYYDSVGMARQMGVLPPLGSGTDRMMNGVQALRARFQRRSR